MTDQQMLLGDEAIAQGALDAGISGIYAYPGTPSTEITEYVRASPMARERRVHCEWSVNEKTAMESALGMSYAGKRAIVCMKHVGLNVAADPFMNAAITGVNGGFIIAVADDPSMHSSQNEQDSRFFGKFAWIPVMEPSNQQEAYEMAYHAFDLSEKYSVPVLLRITTRLAHSRSGISRLPVKPMKELTLPETPTQFILLPHMARGKYERLLTNQPSFENESEMSIYNSLVDGNDHSMGIIACGLAYNYLVENYQDNRVPFPVLKICHYPLPSGLLNKLISNVDEIFILEEGYPIVEELVKGLQACGKPVHGRLDGSLPRAGELNPDHVARALMPGTSEVFRVPEIVVNRPPSLCDGCSHADVFKALNEAMKSYGGGRVFSDIGCYTLGAFPPYESINTCVDMGASVTMAKGAADAGLKPVVCVIGDSTFTHSGMTGLLDAVTENTPMTIIISDNSATAMTGGQPSAATGRLYDICIGMGADRNHVRTLRPHRKDHASTVSIMKEEIQHEGLSVIIAQRECIQTASRRKKSARQQT